MITKQYKKTLILLSKKLEGLNYVIVGSTNLALQGIKIKPKDIDIITDKKNALLINKILKNYETLPVELRENKEYKSYFGKFKINNIEVEVMGNFQYKKQKLHDKPTKKNIKINNFEIPLLTLKEELVAYQKMGRLEKVKILEDALRK